MRKGKGESKIGNEKDGKEEAFPVPPDFVKNLLIV